MSVLTLRPNSDSTPLELNASSSPHYANIDEATLDENDYVGNPPSGDLKREVFGFPDHSSESGTINSVTVKCNAKYILNGTTSYDAKVNLVVKIGSTIYDGSQNTLTSSTAEYSEAWTTNPDTSAAWSFSEIDSLLAGVGAQPGFESIKNNKNPYIYQLWVEVDYTAGGASVKPYYYYLNQ